MTNLNEYHCLLAACRLAKKQITVRLIVTLEEVLSQTCSASLQMKSAVFYRSGSLLVIVLLLENVSQMGPCFKVMIAMLCGFYRNCCSSISSLLWLAAVDSQLSYSSVLCNLWAVNISGKSALPCL